MEIGWSISAIALVFICGWIFFKKSGATRQSPQGNARSAFVLPATKITARKTGAVTSERRELPEDICSFKLRSANDLGSDERAVLVDLSRNIPRPPRLLYEQPLKHLRQAIAFLAPSHDSRRSTRKPGAFLAACSATAGRPAPVDIRDRSAAHGGVESVTILGGTHCGDRSSAGLCYLSPRIAERLSMEEISGPSDVERFLDHDHDPDSFHVAGYLTGQTSMDWRKALLSEETMAGLYCSWRTDEVH